MSKPNNIQEMTIDRATMIVMMTAYGSSKFTTEEYITAFAIYMEDLRMRDELISN